MAIIRKTLKSTDTVERWRPPCLKTFLVYNKVSTLSLSAFHSNRASAYDFPVQILFCFGVFEQCLAERKNPEIYRQHTLLKTYTEVNQIFIVHVKRETFTV